MISSEGCQAASDWTVLLECFGLFGHPLLSAKPDKARWRWDYRSSLVDLPSLILVPFPSIISFFFFSTFLSSILHTFCLVLDYYISQSFVKITSNLRAHYCTETLYNPSTTTTTTMVAESPTKPVGNTSGRRRVSSASVPTIVVLWRHHQSSLTSYTTVIPRQLHRFHQLVYPFSKHHDSSISHHHYISRSHLSFAPMNYALTPVLPSTPPPLLSDTRLTTPLLTSSHLPAPANSLA